jgi:hypothetical protein
LETTVPAPVPGSMWLLAGMLSLLSVIGALWRTRRLALSATSRVAWTVACAAIGPPALASLWLMHRPVERFTVREPSSPTAVAGSAAIASPSA